MAKLLIAAGAGIVAGALVATITDSFTLGALVGLADGLGVGMGSRPTRGRMLRYSAWHGPY